MKSEILEKEKAQEPEIVYPCLMVSNIGNIVLFSQAHTGTLVRADRQTKSLGYVSTGWAMGDFKPFTNKIVLSND